MPLAAMILLFATCDNISALFVFARKRRKSLNNIGNKEEKEISVMYHLAASAPSLSDYNSVAQYCEVGFSTLD